MPSARDLMQKADALMRSNRNLGANGGAGGAEPEIPILTDIVIAGDATVLRHDQPPPIPKSALAGSEARPAKNPAEASTPLPDDSAMRDAQRDEDRRDMAESIYFEVLRDLDVDTVDGMRDRLSAQLMPVFEQMGRDLVTRAEQALTDALREQVASAIERRLGASPHTDDD